jgi:addiction module HigA family antidote
VTDWKKVIVDKIRQQIIDENPATNNYALPDDISRKLKTYMSIREDLILCIKTGTELHDLVEKGTEDESQHILTAL